MPTSEGDADGQLRNVLKDILRGLYLSNVTWFNIIMLSNVTWVQHWRQAAGSRWLPLVDMGTGMQKGEKKVRLGKNQSRGSMLAFVPFSGLQSFSSNSHIQQQGSHGWARLRAQGLL